MPSMISKTLVAALAFGLVHALPQQISTPTKAAPPSGPTDNTELIAKLKTDPSTVKRYRRVLTDGQKLLTGADLEKATVFDFQENVIPVGGTQGGSTATSNTESFPFLIDSGITTNLVKMGPCGVFLPHIHPRANEFFMVIDGEIDFGFMVELGLLGGPIDPSPQVDGKLTKYQGTLFPQGSVHFQINNSPDCKPMTAVATLSSDDPGMTAILQQPAGVGPVNKTMVPRQVDLDEWEMVKPVAPPGIVKVVDACIARCK